MPIFSGVWSLKEQGVAVKGDRWDFPPVFGYFAGGWASGASTRTQIDFVNIGTTGNASDYGDLTNAMSLGNNGSVASTTRGITGGGDGLSSYEDIKYVTIPSAGTNADFGDLTVFRYALAGLSNSTRGVFGGGNTSSDTIDYITIASTGDATDFGDTTHSMEYLSGLASPTRGIFASGHLTANGDTIEYITIASTGNATDFGNLSRAKKMAASLSSSTRGIIAGGTNLTSPGSGATNVIEYITIASTGDATDFGDLTAVVELCTGTSSSTRGIVAGGIASSVFKNDIQYITIASTGNATDFGDLTVGIYQCTPFSNGHGGLG